MKTVKRKPHWPKWAKYKAIDADGQVWFFEFKPFKGNYKNEWLINGGLFKYHKSKKNYKGDWTKSLRKIEENNNDE